MSIAPCDIAKACEDAVPPAVGTPTKRPLHRLAAVRRREGISRRTLARRLNMPVSEIKRLEEEQADIPLSLLYQWQEALGVPVSELLVDSRDPLSPSVQHRAQMLRVMKTAMTILERSRQPSMKRMAQMLVEQILEIMPELQGVSPWPAVGKSRQPSDLGQAFYRRLPEDIFTERLTDD